MLEVPEVHRLLSRYRYGVVGSVAADGAPQSALVGIAITPHLEVIFDTLASTRKYANLVRDPRCSVVIGWGGEQTAQLDGIARIPRGSELKHYQEMYFSTWPDGPDRLSWPGITHFVVAPKWVRYSDYDQRPPLIEELVLPQQAPSTTSM